MKSVRYTISRSTAWLEAQKITEYVGAKLVSDTDVYPLVALSADDMETLDRFFREACAVVDDTFRALRPVHAVSERGTTSETYYILFTVAAAYDDALSCAVQQNLDAFFAAFLAARWLKFANQDEATKYAEEAQGHLTAAQRLLYTRIRPIRTE